uniref:Phytase-like domain-containing protein n=1 Tax=Ostreococcus mediterraneus TaxID=1486918 RepID=A0A7S0KQT5_9CHLO|mmetsp:Transcript_7797/g.28694  ORF Transcript_7797/g.28694 Transcript_7797/m.28694 type:complete len:554 (+) Transcript_7797:268-1929(+)
MNAVGLAIVGVAALADVAAAAANLYGTHDLFTSAASPASVLVDVTNVYSPNGLQTLNSFLTDAEAKNDAMLNGTDCDSRSFFATCYDTPAIGSGLTLHSVGSDGTIHLMGVTDRGPNQDCGDISDDFTATTPKYTYPSGYGGPNVSTGKGFPVPKFSPTVIKGTLDKTNNRFVLDKACNLKRATAPSGLTTDVTGLPTNGNDDTPYDGWCRTALAYDQGGQDMEDIQPIPGTNYAVVVDEYNPSISVINIDFSSTTDCGMVKVRYVPESISLPNAGYTVKNILPRSYDQRRANRGLEGVAVSPDGKTAAAFMQSCMVVTNSTYRTEAGLDSSSTETGKDCEFTLVAFLNITDPLDAKMIGTKLYPLDSYQEWGYTSFSSMDKVKVSGAFWLGTEYGVQNNKQVIAVLERDPSVRIHIADFTDAEYISESTNSAASLNVLVKKTDVTAKLGFNAFATKKLLVDTATVDGYVARGEGAKVEGFAFLNNYTMAIANDNDFGLESNKVSTVDIIRLNVSIAELIDPTINDVPAKSSAGFAASTLAALITFGATLVLA